MKLSNLIDFNPKRPLVKGATAPFIEMADLPEGEREVAQIGKRVFNGGGSKFANGDTLFARITPCLENGKTAKVSGLDSAVVAHGSTEFIIMSAKDKECDEEFVYYLARLPEFRAFAKGRMEGTSGRQRVSWQALAGFEIGDIEKHERKEIGSILASLDDRIAANRRVNKTLETMARTLFKDWFVNFGPVRAKMEGRRPPGLTTEIAALFPDSLDDGGKPVGWMASCIGDEVKVAGGATPSTKEPGYWNDGTHHWATPKDLSSLISPVLLATERRITDKGLARISSGLLPVGTVLLSSRAPIGYLAIAEVPTAINQGFIAMTCNQTLPNLFVLFWCKERMDLIVGNANGSTFQEISKTNFKPIPVVLPSKPVLDAFVVAVNPMYRVLVSNLREIQSLVKLRDSLLPKLMFGEMRFKDAEQLIGDAV